jgi:hypothetical protein
LAATGEACRQERFVDAVHLLDQLLVIPDLSQITAAKICAMRSRAHLCLGGGDNMAMAFTDARVAMSLHPTWFFGYECHADAWHFIGYERQEGGDYKAAFEMYQDAINGFEHALELATRDSDRAG